jgi:hypothetical protein
MRSLDEARFRSFSDIVEHNGHGSLTKESGHRTHHRAEDGVLSRSADAVAAVDVVAESHDTV